MAGGSAGGGRGGGNQGQNRRGGQGQDNGGAGSSQGREGSSYGQGRGGSSYGQGRGGAGYGQGRGGAGYGTGRGGYGQGRGGTSQSGGGRPPKVIEVFSPASADASRPNAEVTMVENEFIESSSGGFGVGDLKINASEPGPHDGDFPQRPGHGTRGNKIAVYANYFELNISSESLAIWRYIVEVMPVKPPKQGEKKGVSKVKTKQLITLLLQLPGFEGAVSDSRSNLISFYDLKQPELFEIPYRAPGEDDPPANPDLYRIRVKLSQSYNVSDLLGHLRCTKSNIPSYKDRDEIIQTLNIIIGHYAQSSNNASTIGQGKHYSLDRNLANRRSFGGGIEALRGFFRSVRPATSRLLLNVNVSHAVCYESLRLDELMKAFGLENKITLAKHLKYLRVRKQHLAPRTNNAGEVVLNLASIYDLATTNDGGTADNAPQVKAYGAGPKDVKFYFESSTHDSPAQLSAKGSSKKLGTKAPSAGGHISVWDYFRKNYPSIQMDDRVPVVNTGSRNSPRYLPAEACQVIAGQPLGRKLSPDETRSMISFAVRSPRDNAVSIVRDSGTVLGLCQADNPTLATYGISVTPSLVVVPARVLDAPIIKYSQPTNVEARNGSWNMTNVKFNRGATIRSWTFMWIRSAMNNPDGYSDIESLREDINEFHRSMREAGINISDMMRNPPPAVIRYGGTLTSGFNAQVSDHLKRLRGIKTEFLLVILPCMDVGPYRLIKKTADRNAAIHTVCMVESKLKRQKGKAQYMANVALKFNLKAGGMNQRLDESKLGIISEGKTMVVGIDVTHPSPESKSGAPSIAGVVASVDKYLAQWPAAVGYQAHPRCEMVSGLEEMLLSRLKLWKEKNSTTPENILVYRDGVSEGQYQSVLSDELPLLRNACTKYYSAQDTKRGLPRITIVIVGKRHHTRFYPVRAADADNSSNCCNGTVVDRGVTEVRYWHFFLQAHSCLQGTAKPAHYYVILDEIFRIRRTTKPHCHAADMLEELTYNMCFLFGRATKSVSICPPAYYADLVCERARLHMGDVFEPLPSDPVDETPAASEADSSKKDSPQTPDAWKIQIHEAIKDSMYYI